MGKRGDGGVVKGILQMEQQIWAGSHMKTAGAGGGWVTRGNASGFLVLDSPAGWSRVFLRD